MTVMTTLIYDGSFNGFLSCIFKAFDEKLKIADIQRKSAAQNGLFASTEEVYTEVKKAHRVWKGLKAKNNNALNTAYFAFLSETEGIEVQLYQYISKIIYSKKNEHLDYSDKLVLYINQLAKKVGREKHRMEAFVRFQLTKDAIYFAIVEPDFNVLPLISKHFRNRYADQEWLIYDRKRGYGIHYHGDKVEMVTIDLTAQLHNSLKKSNLLKDEEHQYQELWGNYFNSTNIKSRINKKLHTQHVPKRYWKYLSEKKAV
ncbi:TIGR03915 family putative DNA repair protein [Flavobacterium sp. ASW18X]|uniref:TIGR03915 family putative DNA repair protein n=1 Tax=Flavobacterium sp. ASW18X TaxID=2572595 RepID=UPI0010AE3BB6|nr:TIGR03915 family putative DNA repair protein [Flavobacterium sp. ASW18X]TKD65969.1 DNA metabolism protein [Flavobacterium sp. ASW18X]